MRHIVLPALDESQSQVVTREKLEVEDGADGVRLLHSPAYIDGLAGGDVIRLVDDRLSGYELVRRGGNLAVVVIFPTKEARDAAQSALAAAIATLAGVCDGGPPRMLVFTVPVASTFAAVARVFSGVPERWPGATWYYGNVYGPDQRLLGWWSGPGPA